MQCLFKLSKCLLYIIVKCDRLTFICDEKKQHHAEQIVANSSGNMLFITSIMFFGAFLFFFLCVWFINF